MCRLSGLEQARQPSAGILSTTDIDIRLAIDFLGPKHYQERIHYIFTCRTRLHDSPRLWSYLEPPWTLFGNPSTGSPCLNHPIPSPVRQWTAINSNTFGCRSQPGDKEIPAIKRTNRKFPPLPEEGYFSSDCFTERPGRGAPITVKSMSIPWKEHRHYTTFRRQRSSFLKAALTWLALNAAFDAKYNGVSQTERCSHSLGTTSWADATVKH
eukprot:Blabericola_migrator_1__4285@NODE_2314_length_2950_cov_5_131460_g1450_i0_p1_GENE_NODE_2314_length_2950_cov_5_131460_g1450_i0NODE_2314_length_2950_cov_5_131460_g1450_i0_p1_ORF_typecomplete_len211_score17_84_NODE_2314_length_2950_cov_5_131460_g1450_i0348980